MNTELPKTYNPQDVEKQLYDFWLENKYFHADVKSKKKPYVISMPPPNITGHLHMGHALDQTLQDILIRFKRMQGYEALWVPGTDHASIATEAKIVAQMKKENLTKEMLGREKFLERAWAWKEKYGGRINEQIKKLGSSCDWDRERFTLDENLSKAVKKVFVKLYNDGLIYRGERLVNWCPVCKTSISDAEVEFEEHDGYFWHISYPLTDGSTKLSLATTRPETLLGDTAIAVHPDDPRYKKYIGKTVTLPLVGREIPIIADEYVEQDFGTGVVKITPAHDPNDFEVGQRHNLPMIDIMDEKAVMNENAGIYQGLDRYEARKKIVADLKEQGYLEKVEDIKHNVGSCYRCHNIIEPKLSLQWFVKMEKLAKPALECVKTKELRFIPDRFTKVYTNWLENIKDWCISRQLWWGHQIPVWYCDDCNEMTASETEVHSCPKCHSKNVHQEEDTLDTWFSSALWPFSTLGWPNDTEDLKRFYPNDTLVTGYDIIFFWVIRMVFSGIEHTGVPPFKNVLIHGMVRDDQGRKMSKSLGNGIDPLEIIEQYGADALRFTLINGNSPGNDMRFSTAKVEASRNFANKIWNASRFIMMNLDTPVDEVTLPDTLTTEDKWIINSLNTLCKEVTDNIEKFELGVAVQKLYDFIWDQFCDWYIELAKARLNSESKEDSDAVKKVLVYVMSNTLKLLHPFMPFITEKIYKTLVPKAKTIMLEKYPLFDEKLVYNEASTQMQHIMDVIKGIRNRRAEMNIPMSKKSKVFIETEIPEIFIAGEKFIKKLAYANEVLINQKCTDTQTVTVVTSIAKVHIPLAELIDRDAEIARLTKEMTNAQKQLDQCEKKLSNETFMQKAPANVIAGVQSNKESLQEKLNLLKTSLDALK